MKTIEIPNKTFDELFDLEFATLDPEDAEELLGGKTIEEFKAECRRRLQETRNVVLVDEIGDDALSNG